MSEIDKAMAQHVMPVTKAQLAHIIGQLDHETRRYPPIPPRLRARLMSSASHWFEELPVFTDYRWWALGRNLGLVV